MASRSSSNLQIVKLSNNVGVTLNYLNIILDWPIFVHDVEQLPDVDDCEGEIPGENIRGADDVPRPRTEDEKPHDEATM